MPQTSQPPPHNLADDTLTDWFDEANCKGVDTDLFFPGRPQHYSPAYAICAGCHVRRECLEDGLAEEDPLGVRAGLTAPSIRRLRTLLDAGTSTHQIDRAPLLDIASRSHHNGSTVARLVPASTLRTDDTIVDLDSGQYDVRHTIDDGDSITLLLARPDRYDRDRYWTIVLRPDANLWRLRHRPDRRKRSNRQR